VNKKRGRGAADAPLDVARIGQRIADRREGLRLRQLELAQRAGLSEAYVNRLENGIVRNPKINDLASLARALGFPLDALLDEPRPADVPLAAPDLLELVARQPGLALAFASIARGLGRADPEDRAFVLGHLEVLARRFGDRTDTIRPRRPRRIRGERLPTTQDPPGALAPLAVDTG